MQTDYTDMKPAFAGMLGDTEFHDIQSRVAGEGIPFGRGLFVDTEGVVNLPDSPSGQFAGVSVHKQKATANGDVSSEYDEGEEVNVLTSGRIWVESEEAVDPTDEVWMRTGDDYQGHIPGQFRTDDDNDSDPVCVQITNARWASKTTAAGLALLEINEP